MSVHWKWKLAILMISNIFFREHMKSKWWIKFFRRARRISSTGRLLFAANSPQINSITCFYCWQKRSLASIFNFRDKTMLFPCQRDHVRRIVRWSVSADIRGWNFNVLIATAYTSKNRWMNRYKTFFWKIHLPIYRNKIWIRFHNFLL